MCRCEWLELGIIYACEPLEGHAGKKQVQAPSVTKEKRTCPTKVELGRKRKTVEVW
jgi:hypothetical protein